MLSNFTLFLSPDLFYKINFSKKFLQEHYQRETNSLDPDQDWHFVGPDLGPYCLQKLSIDDKCFPNNERARIGI